MSNEGTPGHRAAITEPGAKRLRATDYSSSSRGSRFTADVGDLNEAASVAASLPATRSPWRRRSVPNAVASGHDSDHRGSPQTRLLTRPRSVPTSSPQRSWVDTVAIALSTNRSAASSDNQGRSAVRFASRFAPGSVSRFHVFLNE
jgi:hypothetical protein